MQKLFITRQQAKQLGSDLLEYVRMKDSSDRELFKGFEIHYGDNLTQRLCGDEDFTMTPITDFCEINKDTP